MRSATWKAAGLTGLALALAGFQAGRASEIPSAAVPALKGDWPCYHGPNGDFTAPCPAPLVEDLNQARQVWVSEEKDLGKGKFATSGWTGYGSKPGPLPGGNGSPIVYDGKVIVSFFRPSGTVFDQAIVEAGRKKSPDFRHAFYLVEADDFVVAMDASTGKTVWKHAEREGLNRPTVKRGGWGVTPAAHAGRVFAMTTMGRVLAFDAATGKILWRADNGCLQKCEEEKKKALEERKHVKGWGEEMNAALAVIGGVVMVPDWSGGLIGLEAAGGKMLWKRAGIRSGPATPSPFRHDGKEYVVVGGGNGELRMLDPLTGNDLWKVDGLAPLPFTLTCAGGHVFVMVDPVQKPGDKSPRTGHWAAYRIGPKGAERAWTTEHKCQFCNDHGPQQLVTATQGKVTFCCGFFGPAAVVEIATGKTLQMLDVQGAIGHVWGDRRVFRSEPDGDGIWRWFAAAGNEFKECGASWKVSKHGGPAYGYIVPIITPFANGFLFQRSEEDGGSIRCYDLRRP